MTTARQMGDHQLFSSSRRGEGGSIPWESALKLLVRDVCRMAVLPRDGKVVQKSAASLKSEVTICPNIIFGPVQRCELLPLAEL